MSFADAGNERLELLLSEPQGQSAAQDAALARDNQHEALVLALRRHQEAHQRAIGSVMGHAVQIETGFGLAASTPELRVAVTADERRRPVEVIRRFNSRCRRHPLRLGRRDQDTRTSRERLYVFQRGAE